MDNIAPFIRITMDNIGPIIEIGKIILEPIGCINSVSENMENLRSKMSVLRSQEEDINSALDLDIAQHQPAKRRRSTVGNWLRHVQEISGEVESLDQERHNVFSHPWWQNVFSRRRVGKNIIKKTQDVVELSDTGKGFKDLTIDVYPTYRPTSGTNTEVVDLSGSGVESLPEHIVNLENLHALRLESCELLQNVPSLWKLKALKELKLNGSRIRKVPQGIEELVNLEKLDLSFNRDLEEFPRGILCKLSKLQYLAIDLAGLKVSTEELLCLTQLKVLGARFHNVEELGRYLASQYCQGLEKYRLGVGPHQFSSCDDDHVSGYHYVCGSIMVKQVAISIESELSQSGVDQLVLPSSIEIFQLKGCHDLTSLSAIPSLRNGRDLWKCEVDECNGMEFIFSSLSSLEDGQIPLTFKLLQLNDLPRCRVFCDGIVLPHTVSFNLTRLSIKKCPGMKNIFPAQLLQNFPNLEELNVRDCEHLENIIEKVETSDFGYRQESNAITLPKLRVLNVTNLPRLESIYTGTMVCDSLEETVVDKCPMLRRLPISLHMDSEQRVTAPPALKVIWGEEGWWESLKWDDPQTKAILQPLFKRRAY